MSEDLSELHDTAKQWQSSEQSELKEQKNIDSSFEPNLVAFCCHYCAYAAADLAGVSRMQYPTNVRIIEIPCSGRIDIFHILRAFEKGADGVFVAGCLEGNCHFIDGNIRAKNRVQYAKDLLDEIEIGGNRLEMFNLSAAMAVTFVEIVNEMTEKIKKLGPNPIKRKRDTLKFIEKTENETNKDNEIKSEEEIK